jgi:hypothetical protein
MSNVGARLLRNGLPRSQRASRKTYGLVRQSLPSASLRSAGSQIANRKSQRGGDKVRARRISYWPLDLRSAICDLRSRRSAATSRALLEIGGRNRISLFAVAMVQLSPQERKKRRSQLREAQKRRRARLKEESKCFLQVILNGETLDLLRAHSRVVRRPVQVCAAELIEQALLNGERGSGKSLAENGGFPELGTASTDDNLPRNQMELFAT